MLLEMSPMPMSQKSSSCQLKANCILIVYAASCTVCTVLFMGTRLVFRVIMLLLHKQNRKSTRLRYSYIQIARFTQVMVPLPLSITVNDHVGHFRCISVKHYQLTDIIIVSLYSYTISEIKHYCGRAK